MKSFSCNQVGRDLWRYIDRELAATDVSGISAHLRHCDRCRGLYHERAREASQYRMTFLESPFGEHFVNKFRKRMKQEGLSSGPSRNGSLRGNDLTKDGQWNDDTSSVADGTSSTLGLPVDSVFTRRRFRRAATVAAMLFLIPTVVVIGIVFNPPRKISLGSFEAEEGFVTKGGIGSDGELIFQTVADGSLTPGCVLTVPQGVVARLALRSPAPGETTAISLSGPAELQLSKDAGPKAFDAVLKYGSLEASVAPRREGETFEIVTANARATVVGTRFALEFHDGVTRLDVWRGEVRFQAREAFGRAGVRVTRDSGPFRLSEDSVGPEPDLPSTSALEPPEVEESSGPAAADPVGAQRGKTPAPPSAPDLDNPVSGRGG